MKLSDIRQKLIQVHQSVQRDSGYDDAESVTASTCPLNDLKGFDSLLIPQLIREWRANSAVHSKKVSAFATST
jgi:hypothetical protein